MSTHEPVPAGGSAPEGSLPRPKVGVGVLISRADAPGLILIGERRGSHGAGAFALPGGHLEGGESWEACAAREAEEEAGIAIAPSNFVFVHATNDVMHEERLHYVTLFMHASVTREVADSVRNCEPHKCVAWHWLPWDEVASKKLFLPLRNFMAAGKHRLL